MRKSMPLILAGLAILTPGPALAVPCRDAHGKFVKCHPAKAAPTRCKDAKGRFAKCGTKGARPA